MSDTPRTEFRKFDAKDWEHEVADYVVRVEFARQLERECVALTVEYQSRALWIEKMNKILGYDNSDGFHSEPDPHTLAEQLVAQRDHYQRSNQIMSNKYLAASEELRDHQRRLNFLLTPRGQGWVHYKVSHGEPIDIPSIDIQSMIP